MLLWCSRILKAITSMQDEKNVIIMGGLSKGEILTGQCHMILRYALKYSFI
jgi:hypothetical protein